MQAFTIGFLAIIFGGTFTSFAQTTSANSKTPPLCFRTALPWSPSLDLDSALVIIRNPDDTFRDRAASWRERGYATHAMISVASGNYENYLSGVWDGKSHFDDLQAGADSAEFVDLYGNPFVTPSATFLDYLKTKIEHAIASGAEAIHFESAVFQKAAGYDKAFKREWVRHYRSVWQAPARNNAARYRSERLKHHLFSRALDTLFAHVKNYGHQQGREISCYVSTPSLFELARRGMVGPQATLLHAKGCDGVIAEVTPLVSPTVYAGVKKVRTFETALLEFGLFAQQARGLGKPVWFGLAPDDIPESAMPETNQEAQLLASLFYPDIWRFEVKPVFGHGPISPHSSKSSHDSSANHRSTTVTAGAAEDQVIKTLTLSYALTNMQQEHLQWDTGETGVGILLCDGVMFQRAEPHPSDEALSFFYGLALPLIKHGIFVQPLAMENLLVTNYLRGYKALFLSYRFMKPQHPEWHQRLANWVRAGGTLIFIDDEQDAYNAASGWWQEGMFDYLKPAEHLFQQLGLGAGVNPGVNAVGMGKLIYLAEDPAQLAYETNGATRVLELLDTALSPGRPAKRQNYLKLERGPYLLAAVFDETADTSALRVAVEALDLLDTKLPKLSTKMLQPGEQAMLFNLAKIDSTQAKVLAGSAGISNQRHAQGEYAFTAHGPAKTKARLAVFIPGQEARASAHAGGTNVPIACKSEGNLAWLDFENQGRPVEVKLKWKLPSNQND